MDKTVPAGAAMLLDFIGDIEAPQGHGTIYANKQGKLPRPLTSMTLGEVVDAQKAWSKNHGSSAAGRYQFLRATLVDLSKELGLRGSQRFDADLQDRLGYTGSDSTEALEPVSGGISEMASPVAAEISICFPR